MALTSRKFEHEKRYIPMRYIQPRITGTFGAATTIKSAKISNQQEPITDVFTDGAAYQAEE
jgi:hypothetical protein